MTGVLLGVASLCLLAWLSFHWGILPYIDEWRPQIEARASRALGVPLSIGRIEVRSTGWVPAFDLRDVRVFDRQGREALKLARVSAALSPRSLLVLEPRFSQLLVEDVKLDIRRDARGRIHIAGLDVQAEHAVTDTSAADWVFEQMEWVVRRGSLRWTDEMRGAPPLALTDVDLVLRNGLRRHDMRLDATPPPQWGHRFSLRGRFTQQLLARAGDWSRWSGTAYAELPSGDVTHLGRLVTLPFELQAGRGAVRAWVDITRGQPTTATVDVALPEVSLRLSPALDVLSLQGVQGRLEATRDARGVRLVASDFGFQTDDGLVWPRGRLKLGWLQQGDGPVTGGDFSADQLDLDLMARIAGRLPVGKAVHGVLIDVAPQGVLNRLAGRWEGPLDAPLRYELRSQLTGLSVAAATPASGAEAVPARPGVHNAEVEFTATERGGEATVSMTDGALSFPGVFSEPRVPLDSLSAFVSWTVQPPTAPGKAPGLEVKVRSARFASADGEGEVDAVWTAGPGAGFGRGGRTPGVLAMNGTLSRGQADRVARYLPLALPDSLRWYVQDAVKGGVLTGTTFQVSGDLWDFPFSGAAAGRGDFRLQTRVQDVQLAYVPSQPARGTAPAYDSPWPAFTGVSGDLVFERGSMRIADARATLGNLELRGLQGRIADVQAAVLEIEGQARGTLADLLRFVNTSPVGRWLGDSLGQASASGPADLRLALTVPLDDTERTRVRGALTLAGNALRVMPGAPPLEDARGRVDFTDAGFTVTGATARLYGGEASFEGGSQPDGALRFTGRGVATAEALRRTPEAAAAGPLAARLRGQAAYTVQLGILRGHTEMTITSPLVGMAIELPAPLAKPAEATWPLRWQTTLQPAQAGQPVRDQVRLDLANVLQARFVRNLAGDTPKIEGGGIGIFDEAPASAVGLAASIRLGALDIDAWRPWAAAFTGGSPGDPAVGLHSVTLRADRLLAEQRHLTRVSLDLTRQAERDGSTWRARIDSDQAEGRVELRLPNTGLGAGSITARLSRLSVPPSEAAGIEALLEAPPTSVPALDIVIDDFEWRGRKLGRAELVAVNQAAAARTVAREWQLQRLALTMPEAQLSASGLWAPGSAGPGAAGRRMVLDFKLDVADSGAFVERLGAGKAMRGGKGVIAGQVSWGGSPLSPDYPSMNGRFAMALDEGQFLNAEPGAARLLGILSLQALPRRLLLDFRDVYQEGFGFDNVAGDFEVARGIVTTNNLRVRGVQAVVLTEGRFDLARETQDLRVVVVPEISAGTASLAYAVINPVIGLGTFLAQLLLQRPLELAGTREYRVTGGWAEPKIERVEGRGAAPGASASAPAGQ